MFNQDRNDESFVFNIGRRPLRAFLSRVRGPSILKSVVEIRDIRRTSGLMAFRCRRTRCVFGLPAPPISNHFFMAVNLAHMLCASCWPRVDGRSRNAEPS